MHIFYRCLIQINSLNKYDLDRLKRTRSLFSEKKTNKTIKLDNKDNICWYIVYLLDFIGCCDSNKLNGDIVTAADCAKSIYNDLLLFHFDGLNSFSKIIEELENCMKKDKDKDEKIKEIVSLAEKYRDDRSNPCPS